MEFSLRAVTPSDLEAVHQLNRRIEKHDRIPIATPLEEFEDWLADPHFDLATDSRLAEAGSHVVAWGRTFHRPSGGHDERAYLLGAVDPEFRGGGIGSALLRWQIDRAGEVLRSAEHAQSRSIRTRAYDFQLSAIRLYQRHEMVPVRYGDELLRTLVALPIPPAMEGIAIAPWDSARSAAALVASNEAFADHWGSTPRDRKAWEHELSSFGVRLDLSFHALDGERVVGVCRNSHFPGDETVDGRRTGWIDQLSVVRSHRKRGIASALVVASLEAFRNAGLSHAALGVDSENITGAYRLYERLGFRAIHRSVTHQRAV